MTENGDENGDGPREARYFILHHANAITEDRAADKRAYYAIREHLSAVEDQPRGKDVREIEIKSSTTAVTVFTVA